MTVQLEQQAITDVERLPRFETAVPLPETREKDEQELREFLLVLRRALLMVTSHIEHRYLR